MILIIPKILKSIISSKIKCKLDKIIVDDQHGFRPSKLTTNNLLTLHHSITDGFSEDLCKYLIDTDFCKSFDKVNHKILIHKLKYIGVYGPFLSWIESYNSHRI